MDRLTAPDGYLCRTCAAEGTCRFERSVGLRAKCPAASCYERLAAYEDAGLTPEEITALRHTLDEYHKTADPMLFASVQGRLVVLPCKVGDTVYEVTSRNTISEYIIKAVRVELFSVFVEWKIKNGFVDKSIDGVVSDEIGKTVFLTREEAEKALGERRDENSEKKR